MNVTGPGEQVGPDAAPVAGTPLPSRPERARANDAKRWHGPNPVAADSYDGTTDLHCDGFADAERG